MIRQVTEALRTLPFFPGRKVVWMKNCNFLGDSVTGRSSTTEAALDSFRQLLESGLGPDVLLLISASEFDKRRSFNEIPASIRRIGRIEQAGHHESRMGRQFNAPH